MDHIFIGGVKVNGVEGASNVSIGPKLLCNVFSAGKTTIGNASVSGDCAFVPMYMGLLNDADLIDMPVWDSGRDG